MGTITEIPKDKYERDPMLRMEVLNYDHPALRKPGVPVTQDQLSYVKYLHLFMDQVVGAHPVESFGIAANQMGIEENFLLINADIIGQDSNLETYQVINPRILIYGEDKTTAVESCMSIPGVPVKVERSDYISATWQDREWETHTENLSGFAARVFQHEFDHLAGKLLVDSLKKPVRSHVIRKLNKNRKIAKLQLRDLGDNPGLIFLNRYIEVLEESLKQTKENENEQTD